MPVEIRRKVQCARVPLWSVTTWDKHFNGVDKCRQQKVIKYHYFLAADLKPLIAPGGDVKILTTSITDLWTTEKAVDGLLSEGEVVSIPWGGNPNVQYYKGKFITSDNRIATSSDLTRLSNKYLYYFMLSRRSEIGSYYRGAGLKHPEMAKVLSMEIPLPAIEEQERLSAKLDGLGRIIRLREIELAKLDQLVKSRFVEAA